MEKIVIIVISAAIIGATLLGVYFFILNPDRILECENSEECLKRAAQIKENCEDYQIIVNSQGLTLIANISSTEHECIISEEIVETGYLINCTYPLGNEFEPCEGSIFDYIVPPEGEEIPSNPPGGGGAGGGQVQPGGGGGSTPSLQCSLNDAGCKQLASSYANNCVVSTILDDDSRLVGGLEQGYWTKLSVITKDSTNCIYYLEIVNAVDLPPEILEQIIGLNMNCVVPLSEFPISDLQQQWCVGELYTFLYP